MGLLARGYHTALAALGHAAAGYRPWIPHEGGVVYAPVRKVPWDVRLALRRGRWEQEELNVALALIDTSLPVIELGGGLGGGTLALSKYLDNPGAYVVVEAHPPTYAMLKRTLERNLLPATAVHAAVSYGATGLPKTMGKRFLAGAKFSGGLEGVETTTVAALADEMGFERFNLIMDIEGGEYLVIEHEAALIRERCASIVMECHNDADPTRAGRLIGQVAALPWKKRAAAFGVLGFAR